MSFKKIILITFLIILEFFLLIFCFAPKFITRPKLSEALISYNTAPTLINKTNYENELSKFKRDNLIEFGISLILLFINTGGIIVVFRKKK